MTAVSAPEVRGRRLIPSAPRVLRLAALLLLGAPCLVALPARPAERELQPWQGAPKPGFALPDLAGAERALAEFGGRPVLVHFFATWCAPCRPEMEALQRLAARPEAGAHAIVSISIAEPDLRVRRFFEEMPVGFPVLLDSDRAAARAWEVYGLPTSFLLDASLAPRLFVEADLDWDAVDLAALLDLLAGPAMAGDPPERQLEDTEETP